MRRDIARKTYGETQLVHLVSELATCESAPNTSADHAYFQGPNPCTMLIEELENIWAAIAERDDWSVLEAKLSAIDEMRTAYTA